MNIKIFVLKKYVLALNLSFFCLFGVRFYENEFRYHFFDNQRRQIWMKLVFKPNLKFRGLTAPRATFPPKKIKFPIFGFKFLFVSAIFD